eukprot:6173996-Pleurochrysis_carterae.AAC.1
MNFIICNQGPEKLICAPSASDSRAVQRRRSALGCEEKEILPKGPRVDCFEGTVRLFGTLTGRNKLPQPIVKAADALSVVNKVTNVACSRRPTIVRCRR